MGIDVSSRGLVSVCPLARAIAGVLAYGTLTMSVQASEGGLSESGLAAPSASADASSGAPAVMDFNPAFYVGGTVDIESFREGNPILPGVYALQVSINGMS